MNRTWALYALWLALAAFSAGALLSGCGQKGPLYLPDETQQQAKDKKSR